MFQLFLVQHDGDISMKHIVTMFHADRKHSGSMLIGSLEMLRSFFGRK
jgi:hypothetical protein